MKIFLLSLITSIIYFSEHNEVNSDENIFIYEYHPKILGQAIIGFIFIDSAKTQIIDISYKIIYTTDEIVKVKKSIRKDFNKSAKEENIFFKKSQYECYSSLSFVKNKKYSADFYKLININFLTMLNEQRYDALESLCNVQKN